MGFTGFNSVPVSLSWDQVQRDSARRKAENRRKPGDVRIGISGWRYKPWKGVFYPAALPQSRELAYAAGIFNSIEINGTFYSLQQPESFTKWAAETPDDFLFAVKGSRYITHMLKLKNVELALANFFASGVLRLGRKLGPFLWQFPPNFGFHSDRFEEFFQILPRSFSAAISLARHCDKRVISKPAVLSGFLHPLRHAVEVRHPTFVVPEFVSLLRKHQVALVCADTVAWPRLMDLTADFVYCRLHGSEELYVSGYDNEALASWAKRVAAWACGREPADAKRVIPSAAPKRAKRDVFVYFDNDAKVCAPIDAQGLKTRVAKLLKGSALA